MNIVEQYLSQAPKASINIEGDDRDSSGLKSGRMHVNVKITLGYQYNNQVLKHQNMSLLPNTSYPMFV